MADTVRAWLMSKEYLPPFLRDFHDQKDAFKAIEEMADRSRANGNHYIDEVTWIAAQVYTIDIFLWWMGMHGWKLQRARKKLPFTDEGQTIAGAKDRRSKAFAEALGLTPLSAEGAETPTGAKPGRQPSYGEPPPHSTDRERG